MSEWLKIRVLLWNWDSPAGRPVVSVACHMARGTGILPGGQLPVPASWRASQQGHWQLSLSWVLAHPSLVLVWRARVEALGLPGSCPWLCQARGL